MTGRAGYALLEVAVANVMLTVALACLVPVFAMGLKSYKKTEKIQAAAMLASEMLEEVRLRKWDENTAASGVYTGSYSAIGRDGTESASDKTTYDDVDDFNGWTENGVKDPLNRSVSGFADVVRSVAVSYVDANLAVVAGPTDYKQITACVQIPGRDNVCLYSLVTNH